jgi:phage shock protein PspC (stress-responsive transcriptional regulator)
MALAALVILCIAASSGCLSPAIQSQERGMADSNSGVPAPIATPAPTYYAGEKGTGASASQSTDTKIIRTGSLSLEVPDVPAVIGTITGIAVASGGYVSSSNVYTGQGDREFGTLTIRVPAKNFDATLSGVKATGKVLNENVQATDVTEEYVDLSARKKALTDQREQYRRLLEKAETVEDILKVQVQIERVQVELDRLQGRLNYLDSRTDLATLTVNLQEPEPVGGETGFSLVSAVNEGIAGLFGMLSALVILAFTLLPLVILAVIAYLVYRWYRKRKGGAAVTAPAAPPQPA